MLSVLTPGAQYLGFLPGDMYRSAMDHKLTAPLEVRTQLQLAFLNPMPFSDNPAGEASSFSRGTSLSASWLQWANEIDQKSRSNHTLPPFQAVVHFCDACHLDSPVWWWGFRFQKVHKPAPFAHLDLVNNIY